MSRATIDAPAKVNLGLEILGRRDDGYHEIRSVLARISLRDSITFKPGTGPHDEIRTQPENALRASEPNLILSALAALRDAGASIPPQLIQLEKRIPVASGLGGASSDAAATLLFFARQYAVSNAMLFKIGAELGSDVPFFLGPPFALVSGRGDSLTPLPSPAGSHWIITVTPDLYIPAKTQTMYSNVTRQQWSSGINVQQFADSFPDSTADIPPNAFADTLFSMSQAAAGVRDRLLKKVGFPEVLVSGAGPTMFTLCDSEATAIELAGLATSEVPSATVHTSSLGYGSCVDQTTFMKSGESR